MSQSPPSGHGQCSNCHQFQLYTKQICDFCSARLPWAVQQTTQPVMTPPPLPRYPVQPPLQPRGGKNNTAMIIVGVAVLFFIVLPTMGVITLSILGNRIKNTFDTANATLVTTSATNQVSTSRNSECGLMNTAECNWSRVLDNASLPMLEKGPAFESDYMELLRHQDELKRVKTNLPSLAVTPPRCLYASTKFSSAVDELTAGLELEQSAYDNNNRSDLQSALGHFAKASELANEAVIAMNDLKETAGPPG